MSEQMRKYINLIAILGIIAFFSCSSPSGSGDVFTPGSGTREDPFKVYNVTTLERVGKETTVDGWNLSAHYLQTAHITLPELVSGNNWVRIGTDAEPFTGSYDGGGFTIVNLCIDDDTPGESQGMFGCISGDAIYYGVIKNLGLVGGIISGGGDTGGIVGLNDGSMVSHCFTTGDITGSGYVGGIAGINRRNSTGTNSGTVQNCYTTGNIKSTSNCQAGGIVGQNYSSLSVGAMVQNCYTTGNVTTSGTGGGGGVAGNNSWSTVQYCYAAGNVIIAPSWAGGIVGVGSGSGSTAPVVQNCAAVNESIMGGFASSNMGRIGPYTVGAAGNSRNNYGREPITMLDRLNNPYTPSPGLTTIDGEDISAAEWGDPDWWTNNGNWYNAGWNPNIWDFSVVDGINLPILKNMPGGIQNPRVK